MPINPIKPIAPSNPSKQKANQRTKETHSKAHQHLSKAMLTENHAARAQNARQENQSTPWPERIVEEDATERQNHTDQTAHSHHVGTDFPPHIHQHTHNLRNDGSHDDATEKHCRVDLGEKHQASRIAQEREDVRHVAVFAMAQLPMRPAIEMPKQVDTQTRNEDGEHKDNAQNQQLVAKGQQLEVAEEEKPQESPYRCVER